MQGCSVVQCMEMRVYHFSHIAVILDLLQFFWTSRAQDCLRAISDGGDSLPSFSDPLAGNFAPRIEVNPIQAIITSYGFHCCGIIAGWAAYVGKGGRKHEGVYSITFQVWRPSTTDGSTYTKVGENLFESVGLNGNRVIDETPASDQRLHFQPGDVIGYYLEQNGPNNETDGGLQFDENFSQETLYYATGNIDLQTECLLQVGSNRDLSMSTNLGPIISVSFTTEVRSITDCPSTFTSSLFCPSSTSTLMPTFTSTPTLVPTSTLTPTTSFSSLSSKSDCPLSMTMAETTIPPHSLTSTLTQSSTRMVASKSVIVESPTPTVDQGTTDSHPITDPIVIESPIPTVDQGTTDPPLITEPKGNSSTGLVAGTTALALVVGLLIFLKIVILLVIVIKKRRAKQSQEIVDVVSYSAVNQASEQHNQIEQYHEYDAIEPMSELSTLTNEAYGKIKEGTSAHEEYVDDPGNGPRIITSQNIAYGDISTSTTRYDDSYYVNEGLNDPSSSMIENEAYGDISGQGSSSRVTGSLDNTSIPTTRNEAYTSVSTNTERVDTEETYDYVTNL